MAAKDRGTWPGDLHVRGVISADGFNFGDSALKDQNVDPTTEIQALKLQQQYNKLYTQAHGAVVASKREVIHVAFGAGTVISVTAGLVAPSTGAATVVIDILKNGSSVTTADITLDNSHAAFELVAAGLDSALTDYVAEDVFEVQVTATAGGGTIGQGLFVQMLVRESPAS